MFLKKSIFFVVLSCFSTAFFAQKEVSKVEETEENWITVDEEHNPLSPARAAFYSAIFPGAGQIYNKKYAWQLPLIYGGLGYSIYSYSSNNSEFERYRTAYKLRKAGLPDEFNGQNGPVLSIATLESAQTQLRQNRDLSLLSAVIVYVLQVLEASVSAHLLQFDTSDNLTFNPIIIQNPVVFESTTVGFNIKYTF